MLWFVMCRMGCGMVQRVLRCSACKVVLHGVLWHTRVLLSPKNVEKKISDTIVLRRCFAQVIGNHIHECRGVTYVRRALKM